MSYTPHYTGTFKKDYKLAKKRGYNLTLLKQTVEILLANGELPQTYRPHLLVGNYKGFHECHIKPDWLLIWKINEFDKTITFVRTGTHSDLFK